MNLFMILTLTLTLSQHYHKIDDDANNVLMIAATNQSTVITTQKCCDLFKILFERNTEVNLDRRYKNDIGFELNLLYLGLRSLFHRPVKTEEFVEICQHLESLRYFLNITKE
jgi:hypothetical protein